MSAEKAKAPPFEESLQQLEQIVLKLEEGGLGLDESIALYEEGMKIAAGCRESLDQAELRITRLRETYVREEPSEGGYIRDESVTYDADTEDI